MKIILSLIISLVVYFKMAIFLTKYFRKNPEPFSHRNKTFQFYFYLEFYSKINILARYSTKKLTISLYIYSFSHFCCFHDYRTFGVTYMPLYAHIASVLRFFLTEQQITLIIVTVLDCYLFTLLEAPS